MGPVRGAAAAGGLAVGLVEALHERGGLWFGWSGRTAAAGRVRLRTEKVDGMTLATLDLTQHELDGYYNGFSNNCLWPLLHFRIDLTRFERSQLETYRRVNGRFAAGLAKLLRRDDIVWVHDFHLFPLAEELRRLRVRQRIGFFLHTPFPPTEILSTLPEHEALMRSLFAYDLIGFQTPEDLARFQEHVRRAYGGAARGDTVSAFGRELRVGAFPIGIDVDRFHRYAFTAPGSREYARMHEVLRGRDQFIGVDRLDYSKGLLRRMDAFGRYLELHPKAHGKVILLQVAPVSRGNLTSYRDFRLELDREAARVNGRFSRFDWTPVHYLNRALPRRTLAGLYRASRVGVVTPMRDGMNLVAMEYLAAQDPADPGVLVLSRFAGAAQYLREALLVNPYGWRGDGKSHEPRTRNAHPGTPAPARGADAAPARSRRRPLAQGLHRGTHQCAQLAPAVAKDAMILVGDVGGTRTRLALATRAGGAWQLSDVEDGPTTPEIASAIAKYLGTKAREGVTAAAFAAAGVVSADGSIRLTNAGVHLVPEVLAKAAGVPRATLVDDFGAIAEAVPHLPPENLVPLRRRYDRAGPAGGSARPRHRTWYRARCLGSWRMDRRSREKAAMSISRRPTTMSLKSGSACAECTAACRPKPSFPVPASSACMPRFPAARRSA